VAATKKRDVSPYVTQKYSPVLGLSIVAFIGPIYRLKCKEIIIPAPIATNSRLLNK